MAKVTLRFEDVEGAAPGRARLVASIQNDPPDVTTLAVLLGAEVFALNTRLLQKDDVIIPMGGSRAVN